MATEPLLEKTKYRTTIINAVKNDTGHPHNHNMKMQAHHLVSAKGVQLAQMGRKLEQLGYNINVLENLVLLPSTLQGACHLKVQLHRGDHTHEDDDHPISYHRKVKAEITTLERFLDECDNCESQTKREQTRERVQAKLDKLSVKILRLIEKFQLPLTSIFVKFESANQIGCAGTDNIRESQDHLCPVGRNHWMKQGAGQKAEEIAYAPTQPYQLKVGK